MSVPRVHHPITDPTTVNWHQVKRTAWIPFDVVDNRPVNPFGPTGVSHGLNGMKGYGERKTADAGVTCTTPDGQRWILLVRPWNRGWVLPGGGLKPGEHVRAAATRELAEETGLDVAEHRWHVDHPQYVYDDRASDEAWPVTVVCSVDLGPVTSLPPVVGGSDAAQAVWVRADTFVQLVNDLKRQFDGVVFPAHRPLIVALLHPAGDEQLVA